MEEELSSSGVVSSDEEPPPTTQSHIWLELVKTSVSSDDESGSGEDVLGSLDEVDGESDGESPEEPPNVISILHAASESTDIAASKPQRSFLNRFMIKVLIKRLVSLYLLFLKKSRVGRFFRPTLKII